jgi:sterol desaturase/sphingolipid hydroxylase (fatty acid hydroxylase superfamily)
MYIKAKKARKGVVFAYDHWPFYLRKLYDYALGCHLSHILDLSVAMVCYTLFYPGIIVEAKEWNMNWVSKIVAFNLLCEFTFYGFWHWITYVGRFALGALKKSKYNPDNQYETKGKVGMVSSTSGHLQREVLFTTLGWLQSSAYQCMMTHLWATGRVAYYVDFWQYPAYSLFMLGVVTYWREIHFYWVHRAMHPWWNRKNGLAQGDVGAFLYRHVHSLHHKSYNPGPWSGLSMHPVEHFLYYTCTLLPLVFVSHPLHFLYAKFHADIAPIGGHDGFGEPGGGADYHYLHHSKFECNYGVPFPIDFDKLFGTWVEYEDVKKAGGSLSDAREIARINQAKHKAK